MEMRTKFRWDEEGSFEWNRISKRIYILAGFFLALKKVMKVLLHR